MSKLRLHLDADASNRSLHRALLDQGHDVTRTPTEWMPRDADDERQLLGGSVQGRCIFTFFFQPFNFRNFQRYYVPSTNKTDNQIDAKEYGIGI